ncbi:hypothetical protein L1987_04893 [Smallanthus sonchifolius]|uniref:Uncharacterized protein n=1 Tax=Smallanthus sonchifolius TaxID=185202 RepID=A0ACB9JU18_9ASTR|nr:hypothetical protein L1987_04893 [Smallanthus sonchifolius]
MVQRRRATACRRTCRLRFILSTPSLALLLQSHPQSVLDMGGEDEPKRIGGVCEIVAAVSWFLGIVSVTGERTELGFSPAAAPALSNDDVFSTSDLIYKCLTCRNKAFQWSQRCCKPKYSLLNRFYKRGISYTF